MALLERYLTLLLVVSIGLMSTDAKKGRKRQKISPANQVSTTPSAFLICPDCKDLACTPKNEDKLKCSGGIKRGICGCCPVCAKVAGESCGGEWNYLGECDSGLACEPVVRNDFYSVRRRLHSDFGKSGSTPEGRCKVPSIKPPNDPSGPRKSCKSKCSPSFCKSNPKALCSAVDVVDVKRSCQGNCQHTSCQACMWVESEPDCRACEPDDDKCITKFARCIKRQYCTRKKFPCSDKQSPKKETGKFQCMVPKCANKRRY